MSLLTVKNLHAHYGKSHVLHGVNLEVHEGEIACVLGRNGSGRSTMLKALMGIVPPSQGSVLLDGKEQAGRLPHHIVRAGLGYVPEERLIFPNLTVLENLEIGQQPGAPGGAQWSVQQMYEYFPRLRERASTLAGNLSGGEQQMLTLCRSLLGHPRLLLVDEPTEGLAPLIVEHLVEVMLDIHRKGVAILLVEQKMTIALRIAERCLIMGHGEIVFNGTPDALREDAAVRRRWLEVA
jgi:branched-chain amino acid transport system ATP-binding protein